MMSYPMKNYLRLLLKFTTKLKSLNKEKKALQKSLESSLIEKENLQKDLSNAIFDKKKFLKEKFEEMINKSTPQNDQQEIISKLSSKMMLSMMFASGCMVSNIHMR